MRGWWTCIGLRMTENRVFYVSRLHREALKQSATDPKTGVIDVGILTTGVSGSERARRQTLAKELRRLLQGRGKGGTQIKHGALLAEIKEQSQVVSGSLLSVSGVPKMPGLVVGM